MDKATTRKIHAASVRKVARYLGVGECALNAQILVTMRDRDCGMHTALKLVRDWHVRQLRFG